MLLKRASLKTEKTEGNLHFFFFFLFFKIFMNTLKYLQTCEYLLDVDSWRLFANLEELSQVSQSRKTLGDMFRNSPKGP